MDDQKKQADLDQLAAYLADNLPPMLARFYKACMEQGFEEREAFILTQTYLATLGPNGVVL